MKTGSRLFALKYFHLCLLSLAMTCVLAGPCFGGVSRGVTAGYPHIVGWDLEGKVKAEGDNVYGECNVSGWGSIVQVAAGERNTLGLSSAGYVYAVGDNNYSKGNVSGWRGITQVSAGRYHSVGLKSDGTVVAAGYDNGGQWDVTGWSGIIQVSAGELHTVALKSDGTVVAVGDNRYGQCNVTGWSGIIQVAAGAWHTLGLKSDGTVVTVGDNTYGQCNVTGWSGIIQVSGYLHSLGLKSDGTVVAVGLDNRGQCNVSGWSGIAQVAAAYEVSVGLKSDGRVARTYSMYNEYYLPSWRFYSPVLKLSNPWPNPTSSGPVTYTVTYIGAETVTLTDGDVTFAKTGTADGTVTVSGSGTSTRTVTVSGITGDGTLAISIPEGTAVDADGNPAPGWNQYTTIYVDNTGPLITMGSPSASLTRGGPMTYALTYPDYDVEEVTLSEADVVLNRTGTADGTVVVSGNGTDARTVTIAGITGDGTLGISIAAGSARDTVGNPAQACGPSVTFTVDNTGPFITIGNPSPGLTRAGPVTCTVTYLDAETVTLANADVTLNKTGTANGTVAVSGSGTSTRTVTVSGITGNGTLGISIAAGTASDAAGNLAPASGPGTTFCVDNVSLQPTRLALSLGDDTGIAGDNITAKAGWVTTTGEGEEGAVVVLTVDGVAGPSAIVSGGVFSAQIALETDGVHTITAVQTDAAANVSEVSAPLQITLDRGSPVVSILTPQNGSYAVTLAQITGSGFDGTTSIDRVEVQVTDGIRYLGADRMWHLDSPLWLAADGRSSWILNTAAVVWTNGGEYTIRARAYDAAGNTAETSAGFTYGKKPSSINGTISREEMIIGEALRISGTIAAGQPLTNRIVDVILTPLEGGAPVHETAPVNALGEFTYDLKCGLILGSGRWSVEVSWQGESDVQGSSVVWSITVGKAQTRLTLDATSQVIKLGETVSLSGKLTPQPDCGGGAQDIPVSLMITGPPPNVGGEPVTKKLDVMTNDPYGHFVLPDYDGVSLLGEWSVQAAFPGNSGYESSNSETIRIRVVETAGYAIVVQGRIGDGEGFASHGKTTRFAYERLKDRGLLDDDILFLNYEYPAAGIDGVPTKAAVQQALTVWAGNKLNAKPANLYLILVDHGLKEKFQIYPDEISSAELTGWLNTLQGSLVGQAATQEILMILGFCYSGSFINELSAPHRVIIASADENEVSYKGPLDQDNIRQGEYFVTEFFKSASLGNSLRASFERAVALTETFTVKGFQSANSPAAPYYDNAAQHPLLDDNGDGVGHNHLENGAGDGLISNDLYVGASLLTGNAAGDVRITEITPTLFLGVGQPEADFWALVDDSTRLLTIWIEVKSPSYTTVQRSLSGQVELTLPKIVYHLHNSQNERYEWQGVGGFSEPGIYQVFYFAKDDLTGNVSPLMESRVYREAAANSAPGSFSLISPADGEEVLTTLMLDWGDSFDPDGHAVTYTLLVSNDASFSNPIRKEGIEYSGCILQPEDGIQDLSLYYWKVLAVDSYGAITESNVRSFRTNNTNPVWPGWITGIIYDAATGRGIEGAEVDLQVGVLRTAGGGFYLGEIPAGTYSVTAGATNYFTQTHAGITVNSAARVNQNFPLSRIDNEAPTYQIAYTPATLTNQNVTATITLGDGSVTSAGGANHVFETNGSWTFEFQDDFGNTGTAVAAVDWIDKIPPTATISGVPASPSYTARAILTVGGAQVIQYRWRLNDGELTEACAASQPITFDNLPEGTYRVSVIGKDEAGNWQPESSPTVASWEVRFVMPGDVDNSGGLNLIDAILCMKAAYGIDPGVAIYAGADVNRDKRLGLEEAIYILQKLTGLRAD